MGKAFGFGVAALSVLVLAGQTKAAAVPYTLKGTWVCTFPNGQTATIKARAGKQGVSYQPGDAAASNLWINNSDDSTLILKHSVPGTA